MELHALAHLEDPAQWISRVDVPFREQAGRDVGKLVGVGEVPVDDAVIGGVAEEPEPFAAIVGDAGDRGQVGRRHRDAQGLAVRRRAGEQGGGEGEGGEPCRGELGRVHMLTPEMTGHSAAARVVSGAAEASRARHSSVLMTSAKA